MKLNRIRRVISTALIAMGLTVSVAHAQFGTPDATTFAVNNANDSIKELIKNVKNIATYWNIDASSKAGNSDIQTPDLNAVKALVLQLLLAQAGPGNIIANSSLNTIFANAGDALVSPINNTDGPTADNPTMQAVINLLTTPPSKEDCGDDKSNCKTQLEALNEIAQLPITNFYDAKKEVRNLTGAPKPNLKTISDADNMLDANSLLGPLKYNPQKKQNVSELTNAANYVRFASGQMVPFDMPPVKNYLDMAYKAKHDENEEEKLSSQIKINKFKAGLSSVAAMASMGISNLNYLMAERAPQRLGNNDVSKAEAEQNMATWRLRGAPGNLSVGKTSDNNSWYGKMEKAKPIVIQRETLYLLAEINYQMYQQRLLQQRMLASLSVQQLQQLRQVSGPLLQLGDISDAGSQFKKQTYTPPSF